MLSHSQPRIAPLMSLEQLGFLLVAEEDDCGVVYDEGAGSACRGVQLTDVVTCCHLQTYSQIFGAVDGLWAAG